MFQNYLKIALRNLSKYKGYSFINISGLAVGITCFLLISLFISHELNYESWNPNAERIVRAYSDINFGGNLLRMAVTGVPIGPDTKRELPEVQAYCRFRAYGGSLVKREGSGMQNIEEDDILTVDSTFFELFPLRVLEGDPGSCLTAPNSVAISASRAEKYFGAPHLAIGQNLVFNNQRLCKVTAVYEDMPSNSHFSADFLFSMNGNEEVAQSPSLWAMSNNFHTYFLLREGTDVGDFTAKFHQLSRRKIGETSAQLLGMTVDEFESTGQYARFDLQRLTDIHLHSDLDVELAPNGSMQYIWIFGAIAVFVLLIACINFMNLTTARSAHRAREIGVRKVLGSQRTSLIGQFLCETILLTSLAVILALNLAAISLPWFSELTARDLQMPWGYPVFWLSILGGMLIVGLLAGSYPAFFLSGFQTLKVLKGKLTDRAGGGNLRSALVVFQFTTSIVLIIATALVFNQLHYIQHKKLGFQKDQVLMLDNTYTLGDQVYTFTQEMEKYPGIESATISSFVPTPSSRSNSTFTTSRELRQDNTINMGNWRVDFDYQQTLGLEMASGRFFDRAYSTDSSGVILNETAARILGFEEPIGRKIYTLPDTGPDGAMKPEDFQELTILGIVKDFHWESLRDRIGPLCLLIGESRGIVSFRIDPSKSSEIIGALGEEWKKRAPDQPFSYRFMDDAFNAMYKSEQKIGSIAAIFAVLAVFISCLGLFGLASFMAEQRTKEIGIRKVLGAHAGNIVGLLSRDFLKLIAIAFILAIPLGWYGMNHWLRDFAYHIEIKWWVFALAGLASVGIALLSVAYQAIRAALANPVKSLRSE